MMKTGFNVTPVITIPTANDVQILGPNPNRVAVVLDAPTANRYTVTWDAAAVIGRGISMILGVQPLIITREQFGSVIGLPMRAIASGASVNISFIEIVEEP